MNLYFYFFENSKATTLDFVVIGALFISIFKFLFELCWDFCTHRWIHVLMLLY